LKAKKRLGQLKKFENVELQVNENSVRTLEELVEALNVSKSIVSDRLHAMRKIKKQNKWIPHEFEAIQNYLHFIAFSQKEAVFISNCNWS